MFVSRTPSSRLQLFLSNSPLKLNIQPNFILNVHVPYLILPFISIFCFIHCMCVWEHACLDACMALVNGNDFTGVTFTSLQYFSESYALEMTINFYYPTLELFCFSFTQPFTYSKFSLPNPFLFGATPRHK